MRRAFLLWVGALVGVGTGYAESSDGVRVMPLGDSITDCLTAPGGYRIGRPPPGGRSPRNATVSSSGSAITAHNVGYNGALGAGASTDFGFTGSGTGGEAPALTHTAPIARRNRTGPTSIER